MKTKARIDGIIVSIDANGEHDLPVESTLSHRFEVVDGVILEKEKYAGLTDNEVRQLDHEDAQVRLTAAQDEWDSAEEKVGDRPLNLPPLTLLEE